METTQQEKDQALKEAKLKRDAELQVKAEEVSTASGLLSVIQFGLAIWVIIYCLSVLF